MTAGERGRARRRLHCRRACLLAVGLAASLGTAYAVAAVALRNSAGVTPRALSIRVDPPSRTVTAGASTSYAVRIARPRSTRQGLGGRTSLSVASELPATTDVSFSPRRAVALPRAADPTTTQLTVTTAADTPPGTYTLRVRANRPRRSGSTAVRLIVPASPGLVAPAASPPRAPSPPPVVTAPDAFTVSGDLPVALTPGTGAALDLTLANQLGTDLSISALSVQVTSANGPQADPAHPCSTADFSVEPYSGAPELTLPASSARSLSELGLAPAEWPRVSMRNLPVNQDGCKQASLALAFAGTATEVAP